MKLDWQWPAVVVFCVVFVTLGVLTWFGKIPGVLIAGVLAWLIPSPLQPLTARPPEAP